MKVILKGKRQKVTQTETGLWFDFEGVRQNLNDFKELDEPIVLQTHYFPEKDEMETIEIWSYKELYDKMILGIDFSINHNGESFVTWYVLVKENVKYEVDILKDEKPYPHELTSNSKVTLIEEHIYYNKYRITFPIPMYVSSLVTIKDWILEDLEDYGYRVVSIKEVI